MENPIAAVQSCSLIWEHLEARAWTGRLHLATSPCTARVGVDGHVSCGFLPPRLGQGRSWSAPRPALGLGSSLPQTRSAAAALSVSHPKYSCVLSTSVLVDREAVSRGWVVRHWGKIQMWSGNVRGVYITEKLLEGLLCPKCGLFLPLFFAAQSGQACSVVWVAAGARCLPFLMLLPLFLLPTPDTLWQRGCEEQPGPAASLPRLYIPGL